ncbi:hypothetical protein CL652_03190 [bacterium]|nr:hypothetical protein [bacterium]|tara:strand:- start:5447 stop:6424 length:978 start_codon:yes stop_codon:yes gene_type:complete
MSRINIAVLRGGPSSEYEVSLATGAAVVGSLSEAKYNVKDVLISRSGQWHMRGVPATPGQVLNDIDVVFVALHGEYGEDGKIQRVLETYAVPYTGSKVFGSTIAMDKGQTRKQIGNIDGIKMPHYVVLQNDQVAGDYKRAAEYVFRQFGPAYIIKPLRGGSSIGVAVANSVTNLSEALAAALESFDHVIVEQFIQGREVTSGVLENFRDEELYCLPPVEILLKQRDNFWDYASKYDGSIEKICPGNLTEDHKHRIQEASREIHRRLGLAHYSRSDFMVAPTGIYFLEVNTLPGLTPDSLLPKSMEAVGVSFPEFLDHVIEQARKR